MTLKIENRYEYYDTVVTTSTITVPLPPSPWDSEAAEAWEYEYIYPETGVGHTDGDSWYFVEITESTVPDLLGRTFEFGL